MIKNAFVIEFTFYENGALCTTYAGNPLAVPTPFLPFSKAKKFASVDDARDWLLDSIKLNSDFTFPERELVSVKFIRIQAFTEKDITENYIFRFL